MGHEKQEPLTAHALGTARASRREIHRFAAWVEQLAHLRTRSAWLERRGVKETTPDELVRAIVRR